MNPEDSVIPKKISVILDNINDWLIGLYRIVRTYELVFVITLFFISLIIRLLLAHYTEFFRGEYYIYMLKSLEITKGNFIPIHTHTMGLSLIAAPIFFFIHSTSFYKNMVIARVISVVISSLLIFPLYLLARRLLSKPVTYIVLILFTTYSYLIEAAGNFTTEPLFSIFFLLALYFSIEAIQKPSRIILSLLLSGMAYYVRPEGIFLLFILSVSFIALRIKTIRKDIIFLLIGIGAFFLVTFPFLWGRYCAFGSPFTYGENDKLFVDSFRLDVWSKNIPSPSLLEYLRTHSVSQWIYRFFVKGCFKQLYDAIFTLKAYQYSFIISPLLLFYFLYGACKKLFNRDFRPLYIYLIINYALLCIVWHIMGPTRHLFTVILFVILFSAIGLYDFFANFKHKYIMLSCFLILFSVYSIVPPILTLFLDSRHDAIPIWASWSAHNLKGKIAIFNGGDLIMMNLPDTSIAGSSQLDLYAPKSGLSVTRPGYYKHLEPAMKELASDKVTYLIDCQDHEIRPFLSELTAPQYKSWFTQVYSKKTKKFDADDTILVQIYKINWDQYWKDSAKSQ